mgnify:CR=1 FL=1
MQWSELFDDEHEPLDNQIKEFVDSPLWDDLANYLHQTYDVHPKLFYSCCSMQKGFWKGWNVKYKKSGRNGKNTEKISAARTDNLQNGKLKR